MSNVECLLDSASGGSWSFVRVRWLGLDDGNRCGADLTALRQLQADVSRLQLWTSATVIAESGQVDAACFLGYFTP